MKRKSARSGRRTIRKNAAMGAAAERRAAKQYRKAGYKVERTGRGHDFAVSKRGKTTGRAARTFVEVKSGNARLSPAQRRAKRAHGRRYVVKRM